MVYGVLGFVFQYCVSVLCFSIVFFEKVLRPCTVYVVLCCSHCVARIVMFVLWCCKLYFVLLLLVSCFVQYYVVQSCRFVKYMLYRVFSIVVQYGVVSVVVLVLYFVVKYVLYCVFSIVCLLWCYSCCVFSLVVCKVYVVGWLSYCVFVRVVV